MAFILFDEHLGHVHPVGEIRFAKPRATIRDLIRARVELEIERHNDTAAQAAAGGRLGAVVPGEAETALNGERGSYGLGSRFLRVDPAKGRHQLDRLVEEAEQGFLRGRYYVLLDDRQAESLDEMIDLDSTGEATFLLLMPLQGG